MTAPGDTLRNRYQILESLGRGGMADVFLALDTRRQAQAALQVLREDPEFLRRFGAVCALFDDGTWRR